MYSQINIYEKETVNMIITFKLFESVSSGNLKPAYLMTLSEYQEKVSPIFKSFNKFIFKNSNCLKSAGYYGVIYYDFEEYMRKKRTEWENSNEKWDKEKGWDASFGKGYAEKQWPNHDNITDEVKNTYKEYLEFFKLVFGENNLSRIESDETKSNKRSIRRSIDDDTYLNLLTNNEITIEKMNEIFDSVGVKIPTGLLKKVNIKYKREFK